MKLFGGLLKSVFWMAWAGLILAAPLLGAWLGSSLVTWLGGPREAALAVSLLLFPVLPVAWELRSTRQFRRKLQSRNWYGKGPKRWARLSTRLILRTLALNLTFLAALLFWQPKVAFTALATRGDWFLDGRHDERSEQLRAGLFWAASGLEWLHRWANPNPYKSKDDVTPVPEGPVPVPAVETQPDAGARLDVPDAGAPIDVPDAGGESAGEGVDAGVSEPRPELARPEGADWKVGATTWPRPNVPSPVVVAMTAADETSIEAVAKHIAARETEPFARVKALHDWVVTRLRYDHDSVSGPRKPQDAASVFASRLAVCEGYARLLVELGRHTGDRIVFLVGDIREADGALAAVGHAWNAVQIDGAWYLLDATWDDPTSKDGADNYQTDYLFPPPQIAAMSHFPEDPRWQLLPQPLSRGEFLRQPFSRPGLAREGLTLHQPDRSAVEVRDALELRLSNPRRRRVLVELTPEGEERGTQCGVSGDVEVRLRCEVPAPGRYKAWLYTNDKDEGVFGSVAMIQVTRR